MKGCFILIIKTIIAVLVFFGLVHLGVIDFIKDKIQERQETSKEQIVDKAKDVVDLSEIDDEYSVDKNLKILKNRMIIAEHNATGQKMIIIEPKDAAIFTKEDIKSENVKDKIESTVKKYRYQLVKFNKIDVIKHGNFYTLNQDVPYVRLNVEIANLPIHDMSGIIGVADLENGKNLIIISANEKGKYSQIITEAFYKKVK